MRRSIKGQRATLPPQPSRGFSRFFFFDFLPSSNRLIDSLCGRVGSGFGGLEGDSSPFFPSSCLTPLDACWLRATLFSRWSREHNTTIFVLKLKYSPLELNFRKTHQHLTTQTWNVKGMKFETAGIHFITDVFVTFVVVVAFKFPIVNSVDVRKICLLTFVSQKASELVYHDNVKYL